METSHWIRLHNCLDFDFHRPSETTLKLGYHRQRDVPEQYKRTSHKAGELKAGLGGSSRKTRERANSLKPGS